MAELNGQRGELRATIHVTRKATGKVETYALTSVLEGEDAAKAERMVAEINQGEGHGGNAQHGK